MMDVDSITDIASYARYDALAERLRALGLREYVRAGAPLCRWRHGDFSASHDLEDVIAVVDGRIELVAEAAMAEHEVRNYIATEFKALLADPDFVDALSGFLLPDHGSQARRSALVARLHDLSLLGDS